MSALAKLIFPTQPRQLPGHRTIKITLRGLHALTAGILTGAWIFEAPNESRQQVLLLVIASGLAMLLIDLFESGAFLLQVRGLVLLGKVTMLACLPLFGGWTGPMLALLFVVAVISSHAPSKVRYRVVFGQNRVVGATSKG